MKPAASPKPAPPAAAPVPVWFYLLFGALFFWGVVHLTTQTGGFSAKVYRPHQSVAELELLRPAVAGVNPVVVRGKSLYNMACAPCHQTGGQGIPGLYPPLAGTDWTADADPGRLVRIVLDGMQGPVNVLGTDYNNIMVPWRSVLNDADIAAILTYVRQAWDNHAGAVTPEQVKTIRDATEGRAVPWTAAELAPLAPPPPSANPTETR